MNDAGRLLTFSKSDDPSRATLKVDASRKSPHRVNPRLYGKFCEHLGANIINGMEAQILRNPTFARWHFARGENNIYGGSEPEPTIEKIKERAEHFTQKHGLPAAAKLYDAYKDSLAYHWSRLGAKEEVRYSNDVGPHGGRAQRIEILKTPSSEAGLAQFIFLPLHRTRRYEFRIVARATKNVELNLSLGASENDGAAARGLCSAKLQVAAEWQTLRGALEVPATEKVSNDTCIRVALTASGPANIVIGRVLLYPGDHVNYADPEIIQMLRDSKLPLLRWPGGNFVSGYRWRDGVGPVDQRPTRPNPAWEGLEYNFFGTDEFIAYCKTVGCEPLICVNGGDGTPEEAAAWIEYCNGSLDTPMGKLRAQNGHPEPYNVRLWEVGNELSG
ncbi:MAG TPA: alpha-N-arabinofuranosidase, partial [Planctomycetota bacterium]|nr:alpha-N-arabinofuranosidase [Planctomycetota bacterium]